MRRLAGASKIPALLLRTLQGDEQRLEVPGTKALVIAALDNLVEKRGTVLHRLRENLQQVALVVKVDQDVELLKHRKVLDNSDWRVGETLAQLRVIHRRDLEELGSAGAQRGHGMDDVLREKRNMLH